MSQGVKMSFRKWAVGFVLLAVLVPVGAMVFADGAGDEEVIAFVGVNVLTMDRERVLENYVVLVRGDRITEVGPTGSVEVPEDARRIESRGKYLMPGLTEMHGHVPSAQNPYSGEDVSLLYVANGVTTVRGMLGHPDHLKLREKITRGGAVGPTYYLSGPAVGGRTPAWGEPKTEAEGEAIARKIKDGGYEAVKVHEGLALAAYNGLMRAAKNLGLLTGGHVPNDVGLPRVIDARQGTIEHLDGYAQEMIADDAPVEIRPGLFQPQLLDYIDDSKMEALAARVRDAGVGNVPTLSLYKNLFSHRDPDEQAKDPSMRYVPPSLLSQWVRRKAGAMERPDRETTEKMFALNRKIVKTLHDAGAAVYLGSDSPQVFQVPGFSLHEELKEMVAAGLTPFEALAAGTRASGGFFGKLDKFGRVAEGYRADLILVNENPLDDVVNLQNRAGVMVRGRWHTAAGLQKRLDALAESYRQD